MSTGQDKLDQDMLTVMACLWMMPLITIAQMEVSTGFTNNRLHRLLTRLERDRLVNRYALTGARRKQDRWWLTSSGVLRVAHDKGRAIRRQVNEEGIMTFIARMSVVERLYDLALGIWGHDGVLEVRAVRPMSDPGTGPVHLSSDSGVLEYTWFDGKTVDAVVRYADSSWVAMLWVGPDTTYHELQRRFDLVLDVPEATFHVGLGRRLTPTGWVIACADRLAAAHAADLWPGDDALIVTMEGRVERRMRPVDFSLRIGQEVAPGDLGRPERVRRWAQQSRAVQGLNDGFRYRVFRFIAQWPDATPAQLRVKFAEPYGAAVRVLQKHKLVVKLEGGFFLTRRGIGAVAAMDGVEYNTVATRLGVYLSRDGEYRRQQRRHNRGIIDVALKLESEGVAVYAGYRNLVNIPRVTQIVPDAVLCLTRSNGRTLLVNVELEFTARTPGRMQQKLGPYLDADHHSPGSIASLWIFEDRRVAERYAKAGYLLLMMTTQLDELLGGTSFGPHSAWEMYGKPAAIDEVVGIMDFELDED